MDCSNNSARRVEEACPDRSVLERLLLGLVSGEEVSPLEEHVRDCGQCAAVMATIQAADPLIEAVRTLPQTTEDPDDTQVAALVEALCKLPVTLSSSGHRPSLAETTEQLAPFLDPPEEPGELGWFGPYRVIGILGSGGMGIALEAEEPELERRVALKVMNPALATSRSARERFLREARTAASIDHDHVVAIYRVGEHRDLPFLAMPLLKGESLADRLRNRGKLEPNEVVRIGRQIAAALAAAHQQGVVHRDVKPDNVWLEAEPNEDRAKILDFGLARAVDDDVRLTRQGVIAGTPAYMAPEQAHGGPVDERADLFSLGCVLYEMCTGRAPFTGSTTASLLLAVTRHQPAAPHRLDRRVPRGLSDLIMKLLKKDPPRRVQTAHEVLDLLERCPRSSEGSAGWRLKTLLITLAAVGSGIALSAVAVIYLCTGDGLKVLPIDSSDPTVKVVPPEGSLPLAQGTIGMFGHLAISEDGRLWLSGGEDKIVRLWEVETGRELQQLVGHGAEVRAVTFSPDGRLALSAGKDRTVRIWDLRDGREIRRLEGHGDEVISAVFSPDGRHVLSGSLDGTVRLWDRETGETLAVLRGHTSWVRGVAFSPDGRFALSGANDATALVWDLDQKRLVHVLQGHLAPVNEVAFLPGGRLAVSIGFDDAVRLWDVDLERQIQILPTAPDIARCLALVPGSWRVLTPGSNHSLCLWDLKSGRQVAHLTGHTNTVRDVVVSADGSLALSSSDDGTVRAWRLEPPPPEETVELSAYHFQPPRLVAGGQQLQDGELVASLRCFQGHTDVVRCVAFAPDGSRAVSGSKDGTVRLWEVADGREIRRWKGHTDDVLSVAFLADGKRVVSGSRDGTVRIWDSDTQEQTACLEGHLGWVAGVAVSSDGKRIVSASLDRTVRVWDAESGDPLKTLAGAYGWNRAVAVLPDNTRVVCGGNDGNLVLWDVGAGEPAVEIGDPFSMFVVTCLAVSPDGSRVAAGDWGGSVHLWDLNRRQRVLRFEAHAGTVHGIAFLSDDRYLISGGEDTVALIWDTQELCSLYRFAEHFGPVTSAALSPDGRFVLTGSEDHTLRLWPLPAPLQAPTEG